MSHREHFDNEQDFEKAVIALLQEHGWKDGILRNPSEKDLERNWAEILYDNNRDRDRLDHYPLTEGEMRQVMEHVNSLKTPLAINEFINGGYVRIKRDNPDDKEHFGQTVSLKLFDRAEIAAGDSRYQIAVQPKLPIASAMLPKRRGDLMLLINGMPVFHIELKKSQVAISQATNQIANYARMGVFSRGIFSLVQIFVAMNPEETLYFANPGYGKEFNNLFFFHWADFYNEPIDKWHQVVKLLLSIPMAHMLIGFYTIPDKKDDTLKVMRSYQYYAADAIRNKVAQTDWSAKSIYGGFVWHTTGSGKTMTSFKAAQLIAQSNTADKVVFLMDRIELGTQSLEEYRGFAGDLDNVEGTDNTYMLVDKLKDEDAEMKLIVSSIQKMGLVYDRSADRDGGFAKKELDKIRAKRVVFIIDECHRSTFGDTLADIKRNFPGALFFGFTGTPIDDENNVRGMTTEQLFGPRLHLYSIGDGIRDGNVLGFDPIKVITFSDDDVREQVALAAAKSENLEEVYADEAKKEAYDRMMDLPMVYDEPDPFTGRYPDGVEDMLPEAQYRSDGHRRKVVESLLKHYKRKSVGGKFHAMLATSSIPEAIEYYRLLRTANPALHLTAIFDPSLLYDNPEKAEIKETALVEILTDYNRWFDTEYNIADWQAFKKDAAARMAHKKPYKHLAEGQQLHLLIVVNQMLTGFDSKYVNTLYVDKEMRYADLIQAFSRTNRLFGHDKRHGIIVYYRRPHRMERNIREAFRLYAHGAPQGVFVEKIGHNINMMNLIFDGISQLFEADGVENFAQLPKTRESRAKFAKDWRALNGHLDAAKMQGFHWGKKRYKWTLDNGRKMASTIAFDYDTYLTLAQRYKELASQRQPGQGGETEVPYDIEPYLTEINTGKIDTDYMNSRFQKYLEAFYSDEQTELLDSIQKELHNSFARLSAEEQKYARSILSDIQQGRLSQDAIDPDKTLSDYISDYQSAAQNDQIHRFSEAFGLDEEKLRELIALHLPADNLRRGGTYAALERTLDMEKAKAFFQSRNGGAPLLPFLIPTKANKLLSDFIISGGFDIDEIQ